MDKKIISPHIEWFIEKMYLQNFHMLPKVYALSHIYLDCLGYFRFVPIFMPKLCSGSLKKLRDYMFSSMETQLVDKQKVKKHNWVKYNEVFIIYGALNYTYIVKFI